MKNTFRKIPRSKKKYQNLKKNQNFFRKTLTEKKLKNLFKRMLLKKMLSKRKRKLIQTKREISKRKKKLPTQPLIRSPNSTPINKFTKRANHQSLKADHH